MTTLLTSRSAYSLGVASFALAAAIGPNLLDADSDASRGAPPVAWIERGEAAPATEAVLVGTATSPALFRLAHGRPQVAATAIAADVREREGGRKEVAAALLGARFVGLDLAAAEPSVGERRVIDVALRTGVPVVIENAAAGGMKALVGIGFDADAVVLRGRDGGATTLVTVLGERRRNGEGRTSDMTSTGIAEEIDALLDQERPARRGVGDAPPLWAYRKHVVQIKESWIAEPAMSTAKIPAGSVDVQFEVEQFASYNPSERSLRISTLGPGFRPEVFADGKMHKGWFNERAAVTIEVLADAGAPLSALDGIQLRDYAPKNVNGENSVTTETGVDFNLAFGLDKAGGSLDLLSFHDSKSYTYSFQDMEGLSTSAETTECALPLWEIVGDGPCPITAPVQRLRFDSHLAALANGKPYGAYPDLFHDGGLAPLPALAIGDMAMNVQAVWATSQPDDAPSTFRLSIEHGLLDVERLGDAKLAYATCDRTATRTFEVDWNAVTAIDPGFHGTFETTLGPMTLENTFLNTYEGTLQTAAGPLVVVGQHDAGVLKGQLRATPSKSSKVAGFTLFLEDDSMALEGKVKWTKKGKKTYGSKKKEKWFGDRVGY